MQFRIIHTIEIEAVEGPSQGPSPALEMLLGFLPSLLEVYLARNNHAQENGQSRQESSQESQEESSGSGVAG